MGFWWSKKKMVLPHEAELTTDSEPRLDEYSPTWKYVLQWSLDNLKDSRERNDSRALSIEDTNYIRGKIEAYKEIAKLPQSAGEKPPGILSHLTAGGEQR